MKEILSSPKPEVIRTELPRSKTIKFDKINKKINILFYNYFF